MTSPFGSPNKGKSAGSDRGSDYSNAGGPNDLKKITEEYQEGTIFVYGTLMCNDVLKALIDRVPAKEMCLVKNDEHTGELLYHVYSVRDEVFPGMCKLKITDDQEFLENEDPVIMGQLLMGVTAREFEIFSYFEDDEYTLEPIDVEMVSDGKLIHSITDLVNE